MKSNELIQLFLFYFLNYSELRFTHLNRIVYKYIMWFHRRSQRHNSCMICQIFPRESKKTSTVKSLKLKYEFLKLIVMGVYVLLFVCIQFFSSLSYYLINSAMKLLVVSHVFQWVVFPFVCFLVEISSVVLPNTDLPHICISDHTDKVHFSICKSLETLRIPLLWKTSTFKVRKYTVIKELFVLIKNID